MSKTVVEALQHEGGALLFLLPEEILVDEDILKARPGYDVDKEVSEIEELAKSIQEQSQIEPVVVRPASNGEERGWHLVAGRRRRDAALFINAGKSNKDEPYRLPAVVKPGLTAKDALKMAITENLKRKNLNSVQMGLLVGHIREMNEWTGSRGTKKVADFMGVSPATVTQAEKVLTLPQESQDKITAGEWSAQTAFEMLNVDPTKRDIVEDDARKAQDAQEVVTGVPGKKKVHKSSSKGKQPLQAKHVRSASRQHAAAIALRPLGRNEILDFWHKVQSPAYGHPNGSIHLFARTYLMWAEGKIKDATLKGHFDTMVMKAGRGKAIKEAREEKPKKKVSAKPKK